MAVSDPKYCYPVWHYLYATVAPTLSQITISSGCKVNAAGNVACAPDAMRASAEAQMKQRGLITAPLTLETYTLARYIQSEVGTRSLEEQVAVAEAAANQAKLRKRTINDVLLYNQPVGHVNRGYYGPIHGIGEGVSTAPYGRWAATSQDPTALAILIADLVTSGRSGNFARGADDQDGPEAWIGQGQAVLTGYVQNLAARNKYWVGPLPGVDHWRTFLQVTLPGVGPKTLVGKTLMNAGLAALKLPAQRPVWPNNLPICISPKDAATQSRTLAGAAALGGLALAGGVTWLVIRRGTATASLGRSRQKRLGARPPEAGSRGDVSDDEWEVAEDALLDIEGKTGRARDKQLHEVAKILVEIRRTHGHVTPTKPYERAFHRLSIDDQFKIHEWSSEESAS